MPPRIVNFNPQVFQPIQPTQQPKSVLAQLLLQQGRGFNAREPGSGIRSAGQNILGALLLNQAFDERQDLLAKQAGNQADLIKQLFPDQTETREVERIIPPGPGLPDQDTPFAKRPDERFSVVGDSELQRRISEGDFLQTGQQFTSQSPTAPSNLPENQGVRFTETEEFTEPNQLAQLLLGINTPQAPLDTNTLISAFQRQQDQQANTFRVDLGDRIEIRNRFNNELVQTIPKGVTPAARVTALTAQLNRENRRLISENTIKSREKVADLNRQAKAGERVKVTVRLGNDETTGRPITQVGFAKRNDPSDIKFVGKPTVQGAGNQVNVSNLPQIPASLLTGITQSKLTLKSIGRVEEILSRIGKDKFAGLVGPVDNLIGSGREFFGIPDRDQQTIGNITKDLTDALGRMRSGGVISDEEWKTFSALVPQRSDNFPTFVNKMLDFKRKMQDTFDVNLESAATFGFNTGTATPQRVVENFTLEQLEAEKRRRQGQ